METLDFLKTYLALSISQMIWIFRINWHFTGYTRLLTSILDSEIISLPKNVVLISRKCWATIYLIYWMCLEYIYVDTAHEKYNKFWSTTNISHGISLSISLIFLKSGCDTPHNIWLLYIIQSTRRTVRQITSYTLSNAIILGQPKLNLFPIPKMTEQFTHRGFLKLKNSATVRLWDRWGIILPSKTQSNCPNLASFFDSKTPLCCN